MTRFAFGELMLRLLRGLWPIGGALPAAVGGRRLLCGIETPVRAAGLDLGQRSRLRCFVRSLVDRTSPPVGHRGQERESFEVPLLQTSIE